MNLEGLSPKDIEKTIRVTMAASEIFAVFSKDFDMEHVRKMVESFTEDAEKLSDKCESCSPESKKSCPSQQVIALMINDAKALRGLAAFFKYKSRNNKIMDVLLEKATKQELDRQIKDTLKNCRN